MTHTHTRLQISYVLCTRIELCEDRTISFHTLHFRSTIISLYDLTLSFRDRVLLSTLKLLRCNLSLPITLTRGLAFVYQRLSFKLIQNLLIENLQHKMTEYCS